MMSMGTRELEARSQMMRRLRNRRRQGYVFELLKEHVKSGASADKRGTHASISTSKVACAFLPAASRGSLRG